jgi:acetyltransferase
MKSGSLDCLLNPRSVAVVGASDREHSVGAKVARNLLQSRYAGKVWLVNARRAQVAGQQAYARVADLPEAPDLAILCTPAPTVPGLLAELAARGCRAAILIPAGLEALGPDGRSFLLAARAAVAGTGLRLLGPNCVGLLSPHIHLNASFAHRMAAPGKLAFIAQSGALTTALLDWAQVQEIGFSHFISLGNACDVGFPELLDHLADDAATTSILLYIEAVQDAPRFMAAAAAAARRKPVIVVKSGRAPEGARAAASHTGALAGADDVYEAAFRRAGLLRVDTTRELFDVAETLARCAAIPGQRLAIVTNGGGPAILATDALVSGGGHLSALAPTTLAQLEALLPSLWSHGNPVDIVGDAPPERYAQALRLALADPGADAVLLIHAPTAIVPAEQIAAACIPVMQQATRPVLSCWMGGEAVREAVRLCSHAGLAVYATPEEAVDGFLQASRHYRLRETLTQSLLPPAALPAADVAAIDALLDPVRAAGREWLTEPEAKAVLAAVGIPVVTTRIAASVAELASLAAQIGGQLALKILSPDITHKSDVGGVALDLAGPQAVEAAALQMLERVGAACPGARIEGFALQRMIDRSQSLELIVGLASDATFGRFALFGAGGKAVEVLADRALELLPLDTPLATALVARTRISRLLAGYRDVPPVPPGAIEDVLVRLSALAAAVPDLTELDINPLLASASGVIALDARIRLKRTAT